MSTSETFSASDHSPPSKPRRNMRFVPGADAPPVRLLSSGGESRLGELVNESYSGIAAIVASAAEIKVQDVISVEYFGKPMPAVVRRVAPEGERWLVAVEWQ